MDADPSALPPEERFTVFNDLKLEFLRKKGAVSQYERASPAEKKQFDAKFLDKLRGTHPEMFEVVVEPGQDLVVETRHGETLRGAAAEVFMSSKSLTFRPPKVVQPKVDRVVRELTDPGTERRIALIRDGGVDPEELSADVLSIWMPYAAAAGKKQYGKWVGELRNKLKAEGIDQHSFGGKQVIQNLTPHERITELVNDVAENPERARSFNLWKQAYPAQAKIYGTVGNVAGIMLGGHGISNTLRQVLPKAAGSMAPTWAGAGLAEAVWSDRLPGIASEAAGLENPAAKAAVTGAEGLLFAAGIDVGMSALRAMKGKPWAEAIEGLEKSGVENARGQLKAHAKEIATEAGVEGPGAVKRAYLSARTELQDPWIRIDRLLKRPGLEGLDTANPYDAKRLIAPKTMVGASEAAKSVSNNVKQMRKIDLTFGEPVGTTEAMVHKYVHAVHAPERNAAGFFAGIDDASAAAVLDDLAKHPAFPAVQQIGKNVQEMSRKTLDILTDGGLISDRTRKALRKRYPNHVPLMRVMNEMDDDMFLGALGIGPGHNIRGSGIVRAKGSEREVSNIVSNSYEAMANAIRRAEINKANLEALQFARNNKEQLEGLFQIRKAKAGQKKHPLALEMRENGRPVHLVINDPELSKAFQHVGKEVSNRAVRMAILTNRIYSQLLTRLHIDFPVPNKIRDVVEAMTNALRTSGGLRGASSILRNSVTDMKAVLDHQLGRATKGAQEYAELIGEGGSVGGLAESTKSTARETYEAIVRRENKTFPKTLHNIGKFIDSVQGIFEDSTRLSAYRAAKESGKSKRQAAIAARDASFDPLLQGNSASGLAALYLFYNVSVQGITQVANTLSNPKRMAKVVAPMTALITYMDLLNRAVGGDSWQKEVDGYSRSKGLVLVTGRQPDGGLDYTTIPLAYGLVPVKAMIDFSLRAAHGEIGLDPAEAGIAVASALFESYNPVGSNDLLPTTPLLSIITQLKVNEDGLGNAIRPPWQENLRPSEDFANHLKYYDYTTTSQTGRMAIATAKKLSDMGFETSPENLRYLWATTFGGPGKLAENAINAVSKIREDGSVDIKYVPIVRRFFRKVDPELAEYRRTEDDTITELAQVENSRRNILEREVRGLVDGVMKADPLHRREHIKQLIWDGKLDNADGLRDREKIAAFTSRLKSSLLDLSRDDRTIGSAFGVKNGARARLYFDLLTSDFSPYDTPELRKQFVLEQREKDLMTEEVERQLRPLLQLHKARKSKK